MKHTISFTLLLVCMQSLFAHTHLPCNTTPSIFHQAQQRLNQIWSEGRDEIYVPTYAWHNRFQYSRERLQTYNEHPWGGGMGKSYFDAEGDWHGLYAFAFLDSHKNVEPVVGYAFLKTYHFNEHLHVGGGYAALMTARPDIFHNIPFPGVLPWASITFYRVSFAGTYVPGHQNVGNVLFLVTKVLL